MFGSSGQRRLVAMAYRIDAVDWGRSEVEF